MTYHKLDAIYEQSMIGSLRSFSQIYLEQAEQFLGEYKKLQDELAENPSQILERGFLEKVRKKTLDNIYNKASPRWTERFKQGYQLEDRLDQEVGQKLANWVQQFELVDKYSGLITQLRPETSTLSAYAKAKGKKVTPLKPYVREIRNKSNEHFRAWTRTIVGENPRTRLLIICPWQKEKQIEEFKQQLKKFNYQLEIVEE